MGWGVEWDVEWGGGMNEVLCSAVGTEGIKSRVG